MLLFARQHTQMRCKTCAQPQAQQKCSCCVGCVEVLPSLYDFRPERYGLPAFGDTLSRGVVPVEPPWRLKARPAWALCVVVNREEL